MVTGTIGLDVLLTEDRAAITLDSAGPQVSSYWLTAPTPYSQPTSLSCASRCQNRPAGVTIFASTSPTRLPRARRTRRSGWRAAGSTPGGSYVLNEPDGAEPGCRATTTPATRRRTRSPSRCRGGDRSGQRCAHRAAHRGDDGVWVWEEDRPMATYLSSCSPATTSSSRAPGPEGCRWSARSCASDLDASSRAST